MFHSGRLHVCHKYKYRVEVTETDKHSSLLRFRINYGQKRFCSWGFPDWELDIFAIFKFPVVEFNFVLSQSGNKKLECFVSGKHFKANKAIAYPSGSPFGWSYSRKVSSSQPTNIRLGFETMARDKRTSFFPL